MSFVSRFAVLSALSLTFLATPVLAGEGGVSTSYSKKKQGMVHFVEKTEEASDTAEVAEEATSSVEATDPSAIEPAAGNVEDEPAQEDNKVADMIKLPRK